MAIIEVFINGLSTMVEEGISIVAAAKVAGYKVPTLCYHNDIKPTGACGICMVKIDNKAMVRGCATKVMAGKNYTTHDEELIEIRETIMQEVLADHPKNCLGCRRSGSCELQDLSAELNIKRTNLPPVISVQPKDDSSVVRFDPKYCIHCNRCIKICSDLQGVKALERVGFGKDSHIGYTGGGTLDESPCIKCGQCAAHCPVNAIKEHFSIDAVYAALKNDEVFATVQIAPAVRVSIGEAFGLASGELTTKKIYTALRRLGFNAIFDTNFGADLTIMEEASEFVSRFTKNENLPLITTCCPSWVEFMERFHADIITNFSSCKSPMMMLGFISKTYYAKKNNIDPVKMFNVAVMPCTSKKAEINREELQHDGYKDVDVVITTRELVKMIKTAGLDFVNLPDSEADSLLGQYSGGGTIFGATGGVMEAALRTASSMLGEEAENIEFTAVRGLDNIKECKLNIKGKEIRIAVAHGTAFVHEVLQKVKDAKANNEEVPWHFIEVMACTGGCITGGGQVYQNKEKTREKRSAGLYNDDKKQVVRCSHLNASIKEVYDNFLGGRDSELCHEYLHTHYTPRPAKYKMKEL